MRSLPRRGTTLRSGELDLLDEWRTAFAAIRVTHAAPPRIGACLKHSTGVEPDVARVSNWSVVCSPGRWSGRRREFEAPAQRMSMDSLSRDHPWLRFRPDRPSDYMRPEYYDRLLKEYAFEGLSDLELLARFLDEAAVPKGATLLELGSGSGRATAVLMAHTAHPKCVDLVDLSRLMVAHCSARYATIDAVHLHECDAVDFLATTPRIYDRVISLWNLSHSVHQHMLRDGIQRGGERARAAIGRFLERSLASGGRAFLIHYDIQSPEQQLINPWRRLLWENVAPDYDTSQQSPSKKLLDQILADAQAAGLVDFEERRLIGDPIVYESVERALEIFMNFHMEGNFNLHPRLSEIVASLQDGISKLVVGDEVLIRPGCFTYAITRK
jgi:SAM-dependent methyltransferase